MASQEKTRFLAGLLGEIVISTDLFSENKFMRDNWIEARVEGFEGCFYRCRVQDTTTSIELRFEKKRERFKRLSQHANEIRAELGKPLTWHPEPEKYPRVYCSFEGGEKTPEQWERLYEEMVQTLITFDRVMTNWLKQTQQEIIGQIKDS